MDQDIGTCIAPDGVKIAYATMGNGSPLVRAANYMTHLEYDWESPVWRHWLEALSTHHTLVRYDERGCGLSDWEVGDLSFEAWVSDLEAVVDHLGLERFPLLGVSQGGPVAIAYAHRHPEKVSRLILYGTYTLGRFKRDPSPAELAEAEALMQMMRVGWGMDNPAFRQVFTTLFMPEGRPEQITWFNELQRISATPENAAALERHMYNIDVTHLAPELKMPALVLHTRNDAMIPFEQGQRVASLIPGARFVPLEGKNHILLEFEPAWPSFVTEVYRFLGLGDDDIAAFISGREQGSVRDIPSASVLFADMVGFTGLSEAIPGGKMVEILDDIFSHFDHIVDEYGLDKIRVVGDEYMAAGGVSRPNPEHAKAMASAALDMAAYIEGLPAQGNAQFAFRFGLNLGPVTVGTVGRDYRRYDIWGDTVNTASRMESHGLPGKIQITRAVYETLKDEFICRPRGPIPVKGKGEMETWFLAGRKQPAGDGMNN
jgi:class 3 adenylate cyclase/pimeloyl-ACP methyl ester carboxylesterase